MTNNTDRDWVENLRDLYLHKSPDEEGLYSVSMLIDKQAKITFEEENPIFELYIATKDSIEDFIRSVEKQAEERVVRDILKGMEFLNVERYNLVKDRIEAYAKEKRINLK